MQIKMSECRDGNTSRSLLPHFSPLELEEDWLFALRRPGNTFYMRVLSQLRSRVQCIKTSRIGRVRVRCEWPIRTMHSFVVRSRIRSEGLKRYGIRSSHCWVEWKRCVTYRRRKEDWATHNIGWRFYVRLFRKDKITRPNICCFLSSRFHFLSLSFFSFFYLLFFEYLYLYLFPPVSLPLFHSTSVV
jgi:hypothetical protein